MPAERIHSSKRVELRPGMKHPASVISVQDGDIMVDADFLGAKLGLSTESLKIGYAPLRRRLWCRPQLGTPPFDVDQDPRRPSQAHCLDQPAAAGPPWIDDLDRLAICRSRALSSRFGADPHLSVCWGSEPNRLVHERGIEPHILVFDKSKRTGSQWTLRWRRESGANSSLKGRFRPYEPDSKVEMTIMIKGLPANSLRNGTGN